MTSMSSQWEKQMSNDIHSAMEAMGEENQSCYEKRTNFPCIVQAQVL